MSNLILTQIPLDELLAYVKQAVREEIAAVVSSKEITVDNAPPITTKELCKHLRITEPTVIRWRKKGKIPYITIGSAIRFNLIAVMAALENK